MAAGQGKLGNQGKVGDFLVTVNNNQGCHRVIFFSNHFLVLFLSFVAPVRELILSVGCPTVCPSYFFPEGEVGGANGRESGEMRGGDVG